MFRLFSQFAQAEEATRQPAAAEFYSLLERLRAAVHSRALPWAEYPTLVDYASICFWAIRKLEYSFAAQALAETESLADNKPLRVLDVGCGVVPFCNWVSKRGHQVTAIDPLASDIEFLTSNNLNEFYGSNVEYLAERSEQLRFPDGTFDVVTCISVLEHIPPGNDRLCLWEIARVLKPGGSLILSFDVAPGQDSEPGKQPWPADRRRYAYPFSFLTAERLFEALASGFEVTGADLPDDLRRLSWEEVHAFWTAAQEHDERADQLREYLAAGGVLRRRDQRVSVSFGDISAAYLEGQTALAERVEFYASHAEARRALVQRLDEAGQLLREEVEEKEQAIHEKEQAIDELSSVAEERGQVIELLHSVAAERLGIIEELHAEGTLREHPVGGALLPAESPDEQHDPPSFEPGAAHNFKEIDASGGSPALIELVMRQSQMLDRIEGRLEEATHSYERARQQVAYEFNSRLELAERLRVEAEAAAEARLAVIEEQKRALEHYRFWSWSERLQRLRSPKLGRLYQHAPSPMKIPERYLDVPRPPVSAPTISIVTPSLNQGEYIERTIKSVLDQGYPSLEYIVQDAVSNDATPQVLDRYAAQLAHVDSRRDTGFANGINMGFSHATGEIMAYLNSDDLILPGAIHYVAAYFASHPEVDVVYGHRVIIDEYDAEIGRWVLPKHDDVVLSWADYVPQETLFWRRRIWDRAGGMIDERFRFAIDWDLLIRFREAGARMHRLPRFLGAFRVHPHQKTSTSLEDLGSREMDQLRTRALGRPVTHAEIVRALARYHRMSLVYDKLYYLGILRY